MGRAPPGMEDEGPIAADESTMPSFISSFEDGSRAKLSRNLSTETSLSDAKVERSVIGVSARVTVSDSQLSSSVELDGDTTGLDEEKDAEGNNNNNCNSGSGTGGGGERRRASAVEIILRRNFGTVSKSPSLCLNVCPRTPCGPEDDMRQRNINTSGDVTAKKSSHELNAPAVKNEHTQSETVDLNGVTIVTAECQNVIDNDGSTLSSVDTKEHVYCTVYCIANDENLKDHDLPSHSSEPLAFNEHEAHSVTQLEMEMYPNSSPEPDLYTLDDLVDPIADLSHRLSMEQAGAETSTQLCRVCLETETSPPRPCCGMSVCEECMRLYVSSQVRMAKALVSCPCPECTGFLEEGLLLSLMTNEEVARYRYFQELRQLDSSTKPCPQCNHFTTLKNHTPNRSEHKYKIQCDSCQFLWCFKCHAPWHNGLKCREYRKGDKLLRSWASVIEHGQRNAQKCPQCKIHIQRTEGCDHMTCAQCNTNFCYRCGERYRHLRFFGDHTSNLSVFGCKYRYLPGKPHLRRFVRGSVCASKILIAPIVIVLVVVLGALALVIGLVAFPIYYVCKKKKKQQSQGSGLWI
ncbi:hypothetical protein WMY93_015552 [Mugilogobius chulae]|uniref:RBR-type E3 ubiquitin transferase n=1 Tax=Mugilogobius chulae TaxID=88201 RepID=A0AAW0NXI9_9GOBI